MELKGKLKYDPFRKGLKGNQNWRAVVQLPLAKDMARYYRYWTMKYPYRFIDPQTKETFSNLDLVPWSWGIHISIAKGKLPLNTETWGKYDGEIITVKYNPIVKVFHYPNDIDHVFYMDVYSDRLQEIKNELYGKKKRPWEFHISIGKTHFSRKIG